MRALGRAVFIVLGSAGIVGVIVASSVGVGSVLGGLDTTRGLASAGAALFTWLVALVYVSERDR